MPDATPTRTVHVVPHTHWDREWYRPFEAFQLRLGDVTEAILDLLDDDAGRYPSFTLDGQSVVLDDVLAVRPDLRERLERHVRAGRLHVGPWYVLADEFLVSPEALVANLAWGVRTARTFGAALPVAYTPDAFGHVAHLPTLVRGFGLDAVALQRGFGDEAEALGSEFTWRSPDGTHEVLALHLVGTYSSVAAVGHGDVGYRDPLDLDRARRHVRAVLFGEGTSDVPDAWLRSAIERLDGGLDAHANGPHLLLLNGTDHLFPQATLPDVLDDLRAHHPELDVVHDDLETYAAAVRRDHDVSAVHQGELRWGRYHHVLSGVWSTRMPLKQRNHAVETHLERYAGPLLARSRAAGGPDDDVALREAWRTLLLNHPHDSICGCSVDGVADAMHARFDAAERLADAVVERAVAHLTPERDARRWAVFAPSPTSGWGTVEVTLDVAAGRADRVTPRDGAGRPLPHQRHAAPGTAPGRRDDAVEHVTMRVATPLTPLGLAPIDVRDDPAPERPPDAPDTVTGGPGDPDDAGTLTLRNGALTLHVRAEGELHLRDHATGAAYALRLRLEDVADAGDTYDASPVPGDAPRIAAVVGEPELLERGPLRASVVLRHALALPARLADDRRTPVGTATLHAHTTLHLDAFEDAVHVDVALDNPADDHRLRLHLETDLASDTVLRDGHWAVLRRPLDPPEATGWYQRPTRTHPVRRFAALDDAPRGLALLVRGLPEVEAIRHDDGTTLAVTLLRAVGWLSRDDLETRPEGAGPALATPGAQERGPFTAHLAIAPFEAGDAARLTRVADRFVAPPVALPVPPTDAAPAAPHGPRSGAGAGHDPAAGWTLDPPLTLSTLTHAAPDGPLGASRSTYVVRLYNAAETPAEGALRAPAPIRRCRRVRLDETPLDDVPIHGDQVSLVLPAAGVVTLAVDLEGPP
ncbi:MAG: glycoside hydrolase family 38 C-terminal domain-containing protein [Trueperaceae bacterium]|nr:glycoside hydrolase family 38 C-terminal domain-containing protein [Trueperaceae bacterium]